MQPIDARYIISMSGFLHKTLVAPVQFIARRRLSTATPKSNSAPGVPGVPGVDEYPFMKKYSPVWVPIAMVLVLNTLLANNESARDYVEGLFPSYGTAHII